MKPISIFLLAFAFIFGGFIIFQIEEYRLVRLQSNAVKIAKEQAVKEFQYQDTIKIVRSQLLTLIANSNARQDSLKYLLEKRNHVREEISFIHPESLPPDSIEIILTNRFYYTSKP